VEYEFESDWKQLGPLASGVLRSVIEKRLKQAELMEAKPQTNASRLSPAQRVYSAQLDLPFFVAAQPVHSRQARELSHM